MRSVYEYGGGDDFIFNVDCFCIIYYFTYINDASNRYSNFNCSVMIALNLALILKWKYNCEKCVCVCTCIFRYVCIHSERSRNRKRDKLSERP